MLRFLCILTTVILLAIPAEGVSATISSTSDTPAAAAPKKKKTSSGSRTKKKRNSGGGQASSSKKKRVDSNRSEREVRTDKSRAESDISETRRKVKENAEETSRKLSQLNLVEGQIEECEGRIVNISATLDSLNGEIAVLNDSIEALDLHLRQITQGYVKAIKRSQGRRQQLSPLAFIFSSESFAQAYRRLRYLQRFDKWRRKRAAEIDQAKAALEQRRQRLALLAGEAQKSRDMLGREKHLLVTKQTETESLINDLRSQGSALRTVLDEQRARAAALERELDSVIAREAARREAERKAAEEAARKKAAEEAAKKAAEDAAAKKAAEEAAAKKAAEEAAARQADKDKDKPAQPPKDKKKKKKDTKPVSRQEKPADKPAPKPADKPADKPAADPAPAAADSKGVITGGAFENLKGRLPYPVAGSYTIVRRFGRQKHPSLPHVETNNAGIDLETSKSAKVRTVSDGEVSAVFRPDGYNTVVVIRHGSYMTVYANLGEVSVSTGQKVKAGQTIGSVYSDSKDNGRSVLHFEIRNGKQKEDPELWLRK